MQKRTLTIIRDYQEIDNFDVFVRAYVSAYKSIRLTLTTIYKSNKSTFLFISKLITLTYLFEPVCQYTYQYWHQSIFVEQVHICDSILWSVVFNSSTLLFHVTVCIDTNNTYPTINWRQKNNTIIRRTSPCTWPCCRTCWSPGTGSAFWPIRYAAACRRSSAAAPPGWRAWLSPCRFPSTPPTWIWRWVRPHCRWLAIECERADCFEPINLGNDSIYLMFIL